MMRTCMFVPVTECVCVCVGGGYGYGWGITFRICNVIICCSLFNEKEMPSENLLNNY